MCKQRGENNKVETDIVQHAQNFLTLAAAMPRLRHDGTRTYLEDLVLLQHLTGDVEGQVLAVHNTLDKAKVLRDELITVVHDEDTSHIQLDVVLLLLGVKEVKGSTPARDNLASANIAATSLKL